MVDRVVSSHDPSIAFAIQSFIASEMSDVDMHPDDEDHPVVHPKYISRDAWAALSFLYVVNSRIAP